MLRPDAGRASSSCLSVELLLVLLALVDIVGEVRVLAALPPGAEDEIVVIEHLPGRRVHLQDFFWTGEEDAPSWLDPNQVLTLYETHTVHHTATVYIPEDPRPKDDDGKPVVHPHQPLDCTSCIDPTPTFNDGLDDPNIGVLIGDDPGPRYWLLTVLKAGESIPPKIELRLAKLYKAAFSRQQQRHLGLLPDNSLLKNYPKRQILSTNETLILETTTEHTNVTTPRIGGRPMSLMRMRSVRISKSKRTLPILEAEDFEDLALKPISEPQTGNETKRDSRLLRPELDVGLVQVRMQNTSVLDGGATRLIYSVHLGGKPVPAETAAKDMALLSAQEVALELGTPVIIPSEPYLKESRPLALSRSRDAWLLIGAAGASFLLVALVIISLLLLSKRKRAQSSVLPPPGSRRRVIRKDEEYADAATPGIDNTAYTPDTEPRVRTTDPTKRTTPASLSRTPGSQDTIDIEARDISSVENEPERDTRRTQPARPWDVRDYAELLKKEGLRRAQQRSKATEHRPRSVDSVDSIGEETRRGQLETLESLEKGFGAKTVEPTGSPHSYLSMPSCKEFPNMRTVEPLSKVLEPVVVKHLDMELDSPEMKIRDYDFVKENGDYYFARASSDIKDPGVLGPIVWDLKRKRAVEGVGDQPASDPELGRANRGTVGRARKRLNELIEDSFNIFGAREPSKPASHPQPLERRSTQERFAVMVDGRGKSANVSSVMPPASEDASRPKTSLPRRETDPTIRVTGNTGPHPRGAWGSRPLSAGPFHRPNLPEVEVDRVLADSQLRPEDPAVPLIAAIKKELHKFGHD